VALNVVGRTAYPFVELPMRRQWSAKTSALAKARSTAAGEFSYGSAFAQLISAAPVSLLVRTTLWDFIGGLDEQFYPVYYVDVDLAIAMRKLGFVVLYQPNSRIRHHLAASSDPSFTSRD
jgi:GT2 family glycosyltransferase